MDVVLYDRNGHPLLTTKGVGSVGGALITQAMRMKWLVEGKGWRFIETSATAFVIALPTVTAGVSLYNDEVRDWYVVDSVFAWQAANGAAQASLGIAHQVSSVKPATKPTADLVTGTVIKGLKGNQGQYAGAAIIDLALSVADDRWEPVGPSVNTAVVSLSGTQIDVPLHQPVLLPPGSLYSVEGIASAVDITGKLGMRFYQVDPDELFV